MKKLTIRECAVNACGLDDSGRDLLYLICREAMTGEGIDWDEDFPSYRRDGARTLYEAIAPDILASVVEESQELEISGETPRWTASVTSWGDGEPDIAALVPVGEEREGED